MVVALVLSLLAALVQTGPVGAQSVTADFSVGSAKHVGAPVTFTDTSQGSVAWVYWNFGDGGNSRDRATTHTYAATGTYRVSLHVCAAKDDCSSHVEQVTIATAPASSAFASPGDYRADFSVSGDRVAGRPLTFTDRSSQPSAWVWWNFGDGGNSRATPATHTFAEAGTYRVAFTPCAAKNVCDTHTETIEIAASSSSTPTTSPGSPFAPPPAPVPLVAPSVNAGFEANGSFIAGEPVQFTDTSSGSVAWAWWNFGDGGNSRELDPTHTFAEPGFYRIAYSPCAAKGVCSTATDTIQILPAGNVGDVGVEIAFAPAPPAVGEEVLFISRVTGGDRSVRPVEAWSYSWHFGDGFSARGPFPTHTYRTAGTYEASLVVCPPGAPCSRSTTTVNVGTQVDRPGTVVLDVPTSRPRVGAPLVATLRSSDSTILGTFFRFERNNVFSEPGNPSRFEIRPTVGGSERVVGAACYVKSTLVCQLVETDIVIGEPVGTTTGSAGAPAIPDSPTLLTYTDGGRRLSWTDTNDLETGYQVRAGASRTSLQMVGTYPENTQAIRVDDASLVCFEVRVLYSNQLGPAAITCDTPPAQAAGLDGSTAGGHDWTTYPLQPVAGEPVTFLSRRRGGGIDAAKWNFGDGTVSSGPTDREHTYTRAGTYTVTYEGCRVCTTPTRTIVVLAAGSATDGYGLKAPGNPIYVGWQGHPTDLAWTDTNEGEDGYQIFITDAGVYRGEIGLRWAVPANGTRARFSDHPIADYDQICYEIRAVKNGRLGPAATVCDSRDPSEVLDFSAKPGQNPGEIDVTILADVDSVGGFFVRAEDIDIAGCNPVFVHRDDYDYELARSSGDQVRSYSVTVPDLVSGDFYDLHLVRFVINGPWECNEEDSASSRAR